MAGVECEYAREDVKLGLVKHLTATDLGAAMAWSLELEAARTEKAERFEMPLLVAQLREQRGVGGVRQWLDTFPYVAPEDGWLGYHESAVVALGQSMLEARQAELEAAKLAREQAARDGAHDGAIRIFVRNATMDDVPAAMLWAERISDPALRAETIRFVGERVGD